MKKPKYKSYYVIGFPNQTVTGAIILSAWQSTGDGKNGFEETKMQVAKHAASGEPYNGIILPVFDAIRLMKSV